MEATNRQDTGKMPTPAKVQGEKKKGSDDTNLLDGVLYQLMAMVPFVRHAMALGRKILVLVKVLAREVSGRTSPMDRS